MPNEELLKKLRQQATDDLAVYNDINELCGKAADEIERLEDLLQSTKQALSAMEAHCDTLERMMQSDR